MKPQPIATAYDLTTGRGRLRYLADEVLARVTREGLPFDLESWWEDEFQECGTAACAVGWACRDALFCHQGLVVVPSDGFYTDGPSYDGLSYWPAVEAFFGVNEKNADYLFNQECYPPDFTAADVAARIRAYLAKTEGVL